MMRPYEREEFDRRLKAELGLEPTDRGTKTSRAWKTPGGHYVLVPQFDKPHRRYFDYHFAEIARSVQLLDGEQAAPPADQSSTVVPISKK